jgi:hypothetical protein
MSAAAATAGAAVAAGPALLQFEKQFQQQLFGSANYEDELVLCS